MKIEARKHIAAFLDEDAVQVAGDLVKVYSTRPGKIAVNRPPKLMKTTVEILTYDPDSPEYFKIRWGPAWREHVVPDPETIDHASSVHDMVPEAAEDTPREARGARSRALAFYIASACSGYAARPTPAELHAAFHTTKPTIRTGMLVRVWMDEASSTDFLDAWIDHCYSWRELAAACRRHSVTNAKNAAILNAWAPTQARETA